LTEIVVIFCEETLKVLKNPPEILNSRIEFLEVFLLKNGIEEAGLGRYLHFEVENYRSVELEIIGINMNLFF